MRAPLASLPLAWLVPPRYSEIMPRIAQTKNGHPPKVCERCGLPFEWRKKWERDWPNVKFCSDKCRRG